MGYNHFFPSYKHIFSGDNYIFTGDQLKSKRDDHFLFVHNLKTGAKSKFVLTKSGMISMKSQLIAISNELTLKLGLVSTKKSS
jgi:hypothetical protein